MCPRGYCLYVFAQIVFYTAEYTETHIDLQIKVYDQISTKKNLLATDIFDIILSISCNICN